MTAPPTTNQEATYANRQWTPRCPYGDVCTGCDARGYCTRMEDPGVIVVSSTNQQKRQE